MLNLIIPIHLLRTLGSDTRFIGDVRFDEVILKRQLRIIGAT